MSTPQSLNIPGPCGNLEGLSSTPAGVPRGLCLVCHPHPLQGGNMTNKVTYTLARSAREAGLVTLRFNFRGVGASAGKYDAGRGETDDALAAAAWLRSRYPNLQLVLAGFSFGSFVALKASRQLKPQALVTVGTPSGDYFGDGSPVRPACPWLAIHGSGDEVVDCQATLDWLQTYKPPPTIKIVEGAGHFFHRRLGDIKSAVVPFLEELEEQQ